MKSASLELGSGDPSITEFISQLQSQFPAGFWSDSPDELVHFGRDWTRVYSPAPLGIAFPKTTEEVSRFLKLCSQKGVQVVPSGGRTGLSGGAVAAKGEVVLSLTKMNRIGELNPRAQTVRVQAGAVTEAVHQACAPFHLTWPVDFASKGSSTVGGNLSTNAGGVKVIHYGLTRNWVLGLQVVLASGEILELNGDLEKNNTGVDLKHLFIGSEGTLGVITEATLKLTRTARDLDVLFFALKDVGQVLRLFEASRQQAAQMGWSLMAFEFLMQNCLETVLAMKGRAFPFYEKYSAYVLLEIERLHPSASAAALEEWLGDLFEKEIVQDAVQAHSRAQAQELWELREFVSESLSLKGFVYKNDIAVPVSKTGEFIEQMLPIFEKRSPKLEVYLFGHIGDGNLHVNTMKPESLSQEEFLAICRQTDLQLFALLKEFKGSVSAEHGIGLLKKQALPYSRTPEEIRLMRQLKHVFDPQGILNPGKIFD